MDNVFSEKQQRLLTEPLHSSWAGPGGSGLLSPWPTLVCSLRSAARRWCRTRVSLGVELPADIHPKSHRSYFIWEYGKAPDVVIEVVSNREGDEDTEKLAVYAEFAVPYYVIFDPDRRLSAEVLRAYRLELMRRSIAQWLGRCGFRRLDWGCGSGRAVTRTWMAPGSAG